MFIIIQKDTGYIDGMYGSLKAADRSLAVWQGRYPDSEFEIQTTDVVPAEIHDNSRYLPNVWAVGAKL